MDKVVCFGEILLRFTLNNTWLEDLNIPVFAGGTEANVAFALSKWKIPVSYVTSAPNNFLADQMLAFLGSKGIETSFVHRSGDRIGTYYLPIGADLKNSGVIYDRQHSSFWDLKPGMINWENVLEGADWFHFSAVCPALNPDLANVCLEALQAARLKNILISVDLNYRSKLWQYGKEPFEIMPELVQYCDLVMGNIWAANKMLNIPLEQHLQKKERKGYQQQARLTSELIVKNFPQCKIVANTFRFSNENQVNYYAELYNDQKLYSSAEYRTDQIIDQVGSGDCFMAGLIYGYKHKLDQQRIIDFATAAAFQKLFIKGDAITKNAEEIKLSINKL
ncbi:MAG: sugar kinase [Flavobacterium sp.]|nr:sugar kinase [Pedobacter sp.]